MKLSVVTAVFNRQATISEAINSVLSQRDVDLELIVQDGGSTDGTRQLVGQFNDPRIQFLSTPDNGIYDAINRGINRSHGEVIGLMHSDDMFAADDILYRVVKIFDNNEVDGVYGDLDYVSCNDTSKTVRRWRAGSYHPSKLLRGWMPPHPTLYLRREVFEKWGIYDTDFQISADYEAMLRWLVKGKIRLMYLPITMVKMRTGGESNGTLRQVYLKSKEDLRAIKRHNIGGVKTLAYKNFSKIGQFF